MGVNSCDRNGCKNILCDTYIPDIGCICNECQQEFRENFIQNFGEYSIERSVILNELHIFMETPKPVRYSNSLTSVHDFFDDYNN